MTVREHMAIVRPAETVHCVIVDEEYSVAWYGMVRDVSEAILDLELKSVFSNWNLNSVSGICLKVKGV